MTIEAIRIPSLVDNYIWLLIYQGNCIIVDPGDAQPVQKFIKRNTIKPIAVLITHHHRDHVDGIQELQQNYSELDIYGPIETLTIGTTCIIQGGDQLKFPGISLQVLSVPGHTLGHVAYYQRPYLFCGDTLFSGGCGRIFEGTAKQMYHSIEILKELPDDTLVCCSHEYTASNMAFACSLLPNNKEIQSYALTVNQKILKKQHILTTQLKNEKKINIFLRSNDPYLQKALGFSPSTCTPCDVFAKTRKLKDNC